MCGGLQEGVKENKRQWSLRAGPMGGKKSRGGFEDFFNTRGRGGHGGKMTMCCGWAVERKSG